MGECDPRVAAAVVGSAYGWEGGQDDAGDAFDTWQDIINNNKDRQKDKENGVPDTSLVEFYYDKEKLKDMD